MPFYQKIICTPLGKMKAISDGKFLLFLDFFGSKYFEKNLAFIQNRKVSDDFCPILAFTEKELSLYFDGKLTQFSIPIQFYGTEFQEKVWAELMKIPFGKTLSYQEQAQKMGSSKAVRAVANANSKNKIAIIIPCHRVIGKNQKPTGYAGGIEKKEFLLHLEKNKK